MKTGDESKKPLTQWRERCGFIFVASCLLSSTLVVYSLGLFTNHISHFCQAERNNNKIIAFNFAEAGASEALAGIKNGAISVFPHDIPYKQIDESGGYRVHIEKAGSNVYSIVPDGFAPSNETTSRAYEVRRLGVYVVRSGNTQFDFAVIAKSQVSMSGDLIGGSVLITDPDRTDPDLGLSQGRGHNLVTGSAFFGTTLTDPSVVDVQRRPIFQRRNEIRGNLYIAPDDGSDHSLDSRTYPKPELPRMSGGSPLNINGGIYELSGGVHKFSSISISHNAKLKINGDTVIYVDGPVSISNEGRDQGIYASGNLKMYVNGSFGMANGSRFEVNGSAQLYADAGVTIQGGRAGSASGEPKDFLVATRNGGVIIRQNASSLTGLIYAPEQSVVINCGGCGGGGSLTGSVIADSVVVNQGGAINYDTSLGNKKIDVETGAPQGYEVSSWRIDRTAKVT